MHPASTAKTQGPQGRHAPRVTVTPARHPEKHPACKTNHSSLALAYNNAPLPGKPFADEALPPFRPLYPSKSIIYECNFFHVPCDFGLKLKFVFIIVRPSKAGKDGYTVAKAA